MRADGPALDREVPALLVKIGRYPQHHGGVGVLRTLGRAGVPVHAMVEDRFTPAAVSRYLTGRFVRPTSGLEEPGELLDLLRGIGRAIGRPFVPVPTDDEAAILLAEHADELGGHFLLPSLPGGLPRSLADKGSLHQLCLEQGVPTPRACAPADHTELLAVGRAWGYPLVLKNLEAWTRLRAPAVGHTTVVHDEQELLVHCPPGAARSVLVQEYLPPEQSQDWITHLYCRADGVVEPVFTGVKLRSWPPKAGVTTHACARSNPELAALAARFCAGVGFRGVADLDWRLDLRDGLYKLVDFNPRTGAQFRLFETLGGVDVVRALHLDMTGRHPSGSPPDHSRTFTVGQLDLPAAAVLAWQERRLPQLSRSDRRTERAWLCADDPVPALAEAVRFAGTAAGRVQALGRQGLMHLAPRHRRPARSR